MKKLLILGAALSALTLGACAKVQPGYVGVKTYQYGSGAGVDMTPMSPRTYWLSPGENIVEFPNYSKFYTYTNATTEGKDATDESISFRDNNGVAINANVTVQYQTIFDLAPALYKKFRADESSIDQGALKRSVRSAMLLEGTKYSVDQLNGAKQAEFMAAVQKDVHDDFFTYGLLIEKVSLASKLELPEAIQRQINNRVANEQEAIAEQANLQVVNAKNAQTISKANADAEANRTLSASLTPELVQAKAIEAWASGKAPVPTYMGNGQIAPFVNVH